MHARVFEACVWTVWSVHGRGHYSLEWSVLSGCCVGSGRRQSVPQHTTTRVGGGSLVYAIMHNAYTTISPPTPSEVQWWHGAALVALQPKGPCAQKKNTNLSHSLACITRMFPDRCLHQLVFAICHLQHSVSREARQADGCASSCGVVRWVEA